MVSARLLGAVDIGGTTIKTALLDTELSTVSSARTPTPRGDGPDAVVAAVLDAAERLCADAVERSGGLPDAIGVACLGLVDEPAGMARWSAATGWRDVPLVALLTGRTGVPIGLGHDIRAAAYAEALRGAGTDASSMLFLAIGTGIGAAMVRDGIVVTGAAGRAGELGHVPVRPGGEPCGCGGRGCLERYASASAVAAAGSAAAGRTVSPAEVIAAAAAGETWAVPVWSTALDTLAEALATAVVLEDPATIVVGGGLSLAGDALLAPLRERTAARYFLGAVPPITPARLGDGAALLGAGLIAADTAIS